MKSRELLSIVLSLIMVLGVTAGTAYAQTDDVSVSDSIEVSVNDNTEENIESFAVSGFIPLFSKNNL